MVKSWERLVAQLKHEFQLREDELGLLHTIDTRLLEGDQGINETLRFVVEQAKQLIGAEHMSILLRRGNQIETSYSSDVVDNGQRISMDRSLTGRCFRSGESLLVHDLRTPEFVSEYVPIDMLHGETMLSMVTTPISLNKDVVGVLNAESPRLGAFSEAHVEIMEAISSQIAIGLQRAQLFDREVLFGEVDEIVLSAGDHQQAVQAALERVFDVLERLEGMKLEAAQILFLSRAQDELEIVHSTLESDVGVRIQVNNSICGQAVLENQVIVIDDVDSQDKYQRILGPHIRSEIAVPIRLSADRVIGVLNLESTEAAAFGGFYKILLESFADKIRVLLAFVKLRSDVSEAFERTQANDVLVAVGDQTSNLVHRLNNIIGAQRFRLVEGIEQAQAGELQGSDVVALLKDALRMADKALEMPEQLVKFLGAPDDRVDLNSRIRSVIETTVVPDNIHVDLQLAENLPTLPLYSFDLVVQNLVQNAIDAMPEGGTLAVTSQETLPVQGVTGFVELTFTDSGKGMSLDVLSNIFRLNFSTKDRGKGLGFGLWWVRNFVLRSGGDIWAESSPGAGSRFIIKIPLTSNALQSQVLVL